METYNELCAEGKHCYHSDNIMLASHPPQYRHICCKCGHQTVIQAYVPDNHWNPWTKQ